MARHAFLVPADLPGPSGGLTYNRRVLAQWRAAGLDVEEIAVSGRWPEASPADRETLTRLASAHRRVLIDGIIASAAPDELAQAAASGTEISVLVHLPLPAESGLSFEDAQRLTASERATVGAGYTVVCTSAWAQADLQARYGLDAVAVAEPGVDPAPLASGSTPARLLFLGAVTPRKNPLSLLQALQRLTALPWTLVIAGPQAQDPDYAAEVRAAAQALPAGRAVVLGPAQGRDLQQLWEQTDLLVLPSVAETYGMVVTEALSRGIPAMVGSGTGAQAALSGDPEGPRDGLSIPGAAVDPEDSHAWSEVLRDWLSDVSLRQTWSTAAQAHRARLRSWTHAAQDLRTAIEW
ncbi:glycosyltransferase family 4 protein [Nesterenkonia jeotgali]|uniref:Glycosyltransferase involved in cell wall biosynthesis n=1 Tax=Nesterenkonia jeotgali TaxID=317018 RepID=A0A839FLJ9_9MICC|nr:glycosyltransferase family 4 protein [Nesterenkonia jeotgali]MBA8920329.1 glycosyltransferase involved in cell wall biosynthesis [Nesterenkonia jeotgali]